jgi:hypothetical protein
MSTEGEEMSSEQRVNELREELERTLVQHREAEQRSQATPEQLPHCTGQKK